MITLAVSRALASPATRGPTNVLYRNYLVYRRIWLIIATGFFEPVLYLFSIGVGVGALVEGFEFHGELVDYTAFVAPAMLAASAMNGALMEATNIFWKCKFEKVYDAVLATPMRPVDVARGEIAWAVLRGSAYSTVFLAIMAAMGLVSSWWAVLALPAAVLMGFAFAAVGMVAATLMRTWQDMEYITVAMMPMLLFSATFYPITAYDGWLRWIVELTPLYRGVVLIRELTLGSVTIDSLWSVLYLLAMGLIGLSIASRRLGKLLLT
ncbi:MAG TPA: ABC transporter permease [Nocardioidaceae bacterium]|nr:ABC transporter permease [Nocardioidaceae bacterium]